MKQIAKLFVMLFSVLLVGCSSDELDLGAPQKPQHFAYRAPRTRAKQLYQLKNYRIFGAFGINTRGKERIISYNWYIGGTNVYTLKLTTPGDFYQAVLRDFHGKITYWRDPVHFVRVRSLKDFMQAELGWYIPLNEFYYWLRSVPAPANLSKTRAVMQYDTFGHVTMLEQDGWQLQFKRFIQYGRYDLPTMINVVSPHGDKVRIAIKDWLLYLNNSARPSKESISEQNKQLLQSV